MKDTSEITIGKKKKLDFQFITLEIQRGRSKPAKFKHYLKMTTKFYQELRDQGIINPEDYYIDESAFFEFKTLETTISFISRYLIDDLQSKIDHYLIMKSYLKYSLIRGFSV